MLQKSNYYLTRKKDKWQIIYITNARPAHIVPPVSHGIQRTNPPLVFHTASKNLSGWIWGFGGCCRRFCCDLRLENGTLRYIHSQCSFLPQTAGRGRFTLEQKWSVPPRTGFLKRLRSRAAWTRAHTLLDWLVKTYWCWDSTETDWRNATWIGSEFPSVNDGRGFKGRWRRMGGVLKLLGGRSRTFFFLSYICCRFRTGAKRPINPNSSLIQDKPDVEWTRGINTILKS